MRRKLNGWPRRPSLVTGLAFSALLMVVSAAPASAASPSLHACVKKDGDIRVAAKCKRGQRAVMLALSPVPPGAGGKDGSQGPAGTAGSKRREWCERREWDER